MSQVTEAVERRLADDAGLYLAVEEDGGTLVLSGLVGSENQRRSALDIVAAVAPGRPVQDNMELEVVAPEQLDDLNVSETEVGGFRGAEPGIEDDEAIEAGDFGDQPELTDPLAASGAGASELDSDKVSEGDRVYVPPIDPVGTDDQALGGFEQSTDDLVASMDQTPRGDEEMADNARLLLRDDAATTDLVIDVEVIGGRAFLRGTVPTIDDGDLAADVVSRVPGIVEVVDELKVEGGRYV
jgi:osmotically-inducible protein OsmY